MAMKKVASGRFVLRVPPDLHVQLKEIAADLGVSLNDYCVRRLSASPPHPASTELEAVVDQATRLHGTSLVGVVLYGSWARGDASDRSDVDVLIVLKETARLSRKAYRMWEAEPLRVEERPVEVQLTCLPRPSDPIGGFWGEIAIDGIVIFDPFLAISRVMIRTRHDILAGRLQRHVSHGQAYWVRNEAA